MQVGFLREALATDLKQEEGSDENNMLLYTTRRKQMSLLYDVVCEAAWAVQLYQV